jgi:beta-glucanase (GH16 family)
MSSFILVLALGLFACAAPLAAGEWELVWADEFDHDGLPDNAKWDYEEGFLRNGEAQFYTRARLENARIAKGSLIIEGRKEHLKNPQFKPGSKRPEFLTYTAASITTAGKVSWLYGRLEMRAKLPSGKGVWPAFWTLGANDPQVHWPACGEIDIMEFVGKEPDVSHATVHWGRPHKSQGGKTTLPKLTDDFHIFAVEWFPDHMDFFLDKTKYFTFKNDQANDAQLGNAFQKPHFIKLNLALGGSWGGQIDDASLPAQFIIDYVRVYQQKAK